MPSTTLVPARTARHFPMVAVHVSYMSEYVLFAMLPQLLSSLKRIRMRLRLVLTVGLTAIRAGGCAADYTRRADLSSVQTIGSESHPQYCHAMGRDEVRP